MKTKFIAALIVAALLGVGAYVAFDWTVNRIYVPEGYSLMLRYKGPFIGSGKKAKPGDWAQEGEIGVLQKLRGPGRHFYCPLWWERTLIKDIEIHPGEVGIVKCNLGEELPNRQDFIVDGDIGNTQYKGTLRKVLAPGRYRINTYGYTVKKIGEEKIVSGNQVKHGGWVRIPTGYVGVVTNLADNPLLNQQKGIQENVLPPGIYPINQQEQQIDIVEIGFRETTVAVNKVRNADGSLKLDEAGEPMVASAEDGINFPSNDGFRIQMDFTAIWGLYPDQAPHAVKTFGNIEAVENKVIQPQIESICRNNGSRYSAVELLVGKDREKFQELNRDEFEKVLEEKKITLLYGLVRHIYIPIEVRKPIQFSFVADELKLTREQEQLTAQAEGDLREAEENVNLETEKVRAETQRQYQVKLAEGDREALTIEAQTERMIAEIRKETAGLKAEAVKVLGEAENQGKELIAKAKSDLFRMAVEAFGSPEAYNDWVFAQGLPEDVELKFLYAGEGTLWTDSKNMGIRAFVPANEKK